MVKLNLDDHGLIEARIGEFRESRSEFTDSEAEDLIIHLSNMVKCSPNFESYSEGKYSRTSEEFLKSLHQLIIYCFRTRGNNIRPNDITFAQDERDILIRILNSLKVRTYCYLFCNMRK